MLSELQQQRHVELEGTANVRNLGGYHTKDGMKTTKWGVLYRGDSLVKVPSDVAQRVLVNGLHVHAAYDLRSRQEVARQSYHIPNINRYAVPINTEQLSQARREGGDWLNDAAAAKAAMKDFYRELVRTHGKTIGTFIKGFLGTKPSSDNATIFHCTAGKDRTGWTAYVILTLLDVSEEDKRLDYRLTNYYYECPRDIADYLRGKGMSKEVMAVLWTVFDEFLDASIEELDKLGGMKAYAKLHMGLTDADIQQLRDVMLE
jgi:protein-tyrosine phosphatase